MCVHVCVCICVWMSAYVHVCVHVCVCAFCCTIQNHTLKAIISITWGVLDPCDIDTVVQVLAVKWDSSNSEKKTSRSIKFPNFNSLFTSHVWRIKTRSPRAESIPVNMTYTAIIGHLCQCYLAVSSRKSLQGKCGTKAVNNFNDLFMKS